MPETTVSSVPVEIPQDLQALLSKPVLWPEEVRRVLRLARHYGVAVRIERRDFENWPAGWCETDRTGNDEQAD